MLSQSVRASRAAKPDKWTYYRLMGIREAAKHGHPLVRAGVVIAAAFLIILLIMTAVSVVFGLLWTLIKIVLFALLVAGILHMWGRSRAAGRK